MSDVEFVADLTSDHIGQRVRLQVEKGAYVEGTLLLIEHVGLPAQGWKVVTHVMLREFGHFPIVGTPEYTQFQTEPAYSASIVKN